MGHLIGRAKIIKIFVPYNIKTCVGEVLSAQYLSADSVGSSRCPLLSATQVGGGLCW